MAFYYPEFGGSRNYEDIWHSLSIRLVLGDMLRVVYSVAALHFSEAKLISLGNTGAVAIFSKYVTWSCLVRLHLKARSLDKWRLGSYMARNCASIHRKMHGDQTSVLFLKKGLKSGWVSSTKLVF